MTTFFNSFEMTFMLKMFSISASSTRSSARKTRTSQDETTSPPAKGQRLDSSPGGDLEPLPLSPQSGGVGADRSLFSSPPQSRLGGI